MAYSISSSTRWLDMRRVSLNNTLCQNNDGQRYCLQFGRDPPTFTPLRNGNDDVTIISRAISTVSVHPNFLTQIDYSLITANNPDCLSTSSDSSVVPLPQLEYRINGSLNWKTVEAGNLKIA